VTYPLHLARWSCLVLVAYLQAGCDAHSSGSPAGELRPWQGTGRMIATTYDGAPQAGDMAWGVTADRCHIRRDGQVNADPYMFTRRRRSRIPTGTL